MRIPILPALLFLFSIPLLKAQNTPILHCGCAEMQQLYPNLQLKQLQLDEMLHEKGQQTTGAKGFLQDYTLPVVVHIIHQNGAENITDAQVFDAIEHLNQAYAHVGYYATKGQGAKVPVEFCLARRDPAGLETNGITRTASPLTNMTLEYHDEALKSLDRWDSQQYVNIWVVKEIESISSGAAINGYAFFPSSHGHTEDGIVVEADYFGVSPEKDAVLIHETGHYLGLYHTFEGGCTNDDCTIDGDKVCDTPPDKATHSVCEFNSCSTDIAPGSPFTADVDDYTGDFMDYSPYSCYYFFTEGQSMRASNTMEHIRTSLLESKGCLAPCTQMLTASFSIVQNPVVALQSIQFQDNSIGATQYHWYDNGVEFSQVQNPVYTFPDVAIHTVQLRTGNADPNCIEAVEAVVEVKCPLHASFVADSVIALLGSSIKFTNQSNGNDINEFEWSVNGEALSNAKDYTHLFAEPGAYYITLKATGALCSTDTTVQVLIKSGCGNIPEPVEVQYTSQAKAFISRDVMVTSDGSLVHCGSQYAYPFVGKWDKMGNLLWKKLFELNFSGGFLQLDTFPGGDIIVAGEASGNGLLLCKLNASGEILWTKALPPLYYNGNRIRMIATNPDGSFVVHLLDSPPDNLIKISSDGDIIWARKFDQPLYLGSIRRATDGSGDLLMLRRSQIPPYNAFLLRCSQEDGHVKSSTTLKLGAVSNSLISSYELMTHSDGGYSILWSLYLGNNNWPVVLSRFSADNTLMWSKKYFFSFTTKPENTFVRALPGDNGWHIVYSKNSQNPDENGNILQRLNKDGAVEWERKWGEKSYDDYSIMAPAWHEGHVRGATIPANSFYYRILNFSDEKIPIACFPIIQPDVEITDFPITSFPSIDSIYNTPVAQSINDMIPVLSNYYLTKSNGCTTVPSCTEICDNDIDDDGDLFVDCYDEDCPCKTEDQACFQSASDLDFSIKLGWSAGTGLKIPASDVPLVANLNPETDQIPEILAEAWIKEESQYGIMILNGDGSNKDAPSLLSVPGGLKSSAPTHFAIADLDRDGKPEVVALNNENKMVIFRDFDPAANPPMKLWVAFPFDTENLNGTISIADFNGDSTPEIYMGGEIYLLTLNGANPPTIDWVLSGKGNWGYSSTYLPIVSSTAADILSIEDCNGDPDCEGLELVAGGSVYSVDVSDSDGDGFEIKEKRNLNQIDTGAITYEDGFTAVADIDLDGSPEVLSSARYLPAGDGMNNGIVAWDAHGLKRFFPINGITSSYGFGGHMLIANVFDDRKAGFGVDMPEIIVSGRNQLYCFNENMAHKSPENPTWWTLITDENLGQTSASAFDFNGDGKLEIVYKDQKYLNVIYGDAFPLPPGVDKNRRWARLPLKSVTAQEYPVIANIDGDPEAEIVVMSSDSNAVHVFESDLKKWQPARAVWNQYNYFNVNINDDLSVPLIQSKHWLPGAVGYYPFNSNHVQGPAPDSVIEWHRPTPDIILNVDSTRCLADSMLLFLSLCNQGETTAPAGFPIALYKSDPTVSDAQLLTTPVFCPTALKKGQCLKMELMVPAQYNAPGFIVANDDGSLPRPYQLGSGFDAAGPDECRYENNITSFVFPYQQPVLNLGPDFLICNSSVSQLSAGPFFQKYTWQDGSIDSTYTAYGPGKYWVTTKDACGFQYSDTIAITLNTLNTISLPDSAAVCKGDTISLAVSGFDSYQWSPAEYMDCNDCAEVKVKIPSRFTLFITAEKNGCLVTDSIEMVVKPGPALQLSSFNGACLSPAHIIAETGPGHPALLWSTGATSDTMFTMQAGTYSVTATGADGCVSIDSATVDILVSIGLLINKSVAPIPCSGGPGFIAVSGLGGSGQYGFEWSTGGTAQYIEVVTPGYYGVTMTDVTTSGCSVRDSVLVGLDGILKLQTVFSPVSCFGFQDGSVAVAPVAGVAPFTWNWDSGPADSLWTGLPAGNYTVSVGDSRGCSGTAHVLLSDPPPLSVSVQASTPVICPNLPVNLLATALGGTPAYSFIWNTGATEDALNQVTEGNYSVSVTDQHDCQSSAEISLVAAPEFTVQFDSIHPAGSPFEADGAVEISLSGGVGPFHALWSNGDTTLNLEMALPGIYSLEITDAAGCLQYFIVEVNYVLNTTGADQNACEVYLLPTLAYPGQSAVLKVKALHTQEMEMRLFDTMGRLYQRDRFNAGNGWSNHMFQMPEAAGMYFLELKSGFFSRVLKCVVEN